VQQGHADLAAAGLKRLEDSLAAQGGKPEALAGELHKYQDALAAAAMTDHIAADSMGSVFAADVGAHNLRKYVKIK